MLFLQCQLEIYKSTCRCGVVLYICRLWGCSATQPAITLFLCFMRKKGVKRKHFKWPSFSVESNVKQIECRAVSALLKKNSNF
jgi:hypothetical protein